MVRGMGTGRQRAQRSRRVRHLQPRIAREGLERADADHPQRYRTSHPGGAGHRSVHRVAGEERTVEVPALPG